MSTSHRKGGSTWSGAEPLHLQTARVGGVSVVIANRNGDKFIGECLKSLLKEKGNYEIVVVDDASGDGSVEVIKQYKDKRIKLIGLRKRVGAAKARNRGVKQASGEYLFFVDNDTVVRTGWNKEIGNFFERNKDTGAAQVKLLKMHTSKYDSAGEMISSLGFLVERARRADDIGQFDQEEEIFSGKSAGMIIRREVFKDLGGFDSDYVIFSGGFGLVGGR